MTANLIDVEYVHIESYRSRLKKSIPILDIQKSSVVRGLAIYVNVSGASDGNRSYV